ncbi:MAG TPA: hypothetical protein VLG46_09940, partial [Anaerolineae bacterium]|nr:hypothetical protein [Anaerolineae bacterium]
GYGGVGREFPGRAESGTGREPFQLQTVRTPMRSTQDRVQLMIAAWHDRICCQFTPEIGIKQM